MGKIRVATLGSEEEQKQKEKAEKRRAIKDVVSTEAKTEENIVPAQKAIKKTGYKKKTQVTRKESKRHKENLTLVEPTKTYTLKEGLSLLFKMKPASFDETVELHINTNEAGISGSFTLPHGSGKKTRVAILQPLKDPEAAEALIAQIQAGIVNFDILLATPDAMAKLARVAKILGPRGLMPNPKNGTITASPNQIAKKYEGGQTNFKTEAKLPVLHLYVGKLSFGPEKLAENITVALQAIQSKRVRNIILKSTMSAGIRLQV